MNELVTGEAVVLGLRPARLPSRALAVLIDLVVASAAYVAVSLLLLSAAGSMDEAALAAISVATFVLLLVGVPIAVETLSHGRSLGKLACGLRVVREDGGPIRFRHALVRGAMGAIETVMTMGVVACIASLVSARGRRLGDVFAGTLVIRERVPVPQGGLALPPPPPWLAAEVGGLDLSRVPDGWWLTVRQYLARLGQLDPAVGGAMALRLVGDLAGWTGTAAPRGVDPTFYLVAVTSERQAREARRAFGAPGSVPGGGGTPGSWGSVPGAVPGSAGGAVGAPFTTGAMGQPLPGWPSPSPGQAPVADGAGRGGGRQAEPGGERAPVPAAPPVAGHPAERQGAEQQEQRRTGFAPPA
ncbi:RDD family protein [Streptomyces sp. NPDC003077]|uniref:RDD family protein n=1 Tax=Streptomyces sp. NPDC003077 TaxID=3154443 RepID=UPI0033AB3E95